MVMVPVVLPLKAECWQCGERYNLDPVMAGDIVEMALRQWTCEPCNDPED